jgi:hypothetical protein
MAEPETPERVGPVLEASEAGRGVAAAIRLLNRDVIVDDRGAYLRVSVAGRCQVTRDAIERVLGRPFQIPSDLEALMPSFKGRIVIRDDSVEWSAGKES